MNGMKPAFEPSGVWLRTCEEEVYEPLEGRVTGAIPIWLKGTLLRNGPGANRIGGTRLNHVFDGPALLHRFAIDDGKVTYNCRFLKSNAYTKNRKANRLVVSEFGTKAVPDPCQSIFERFASLFHPMEQVSDNASISVYPFGDEMYVFSEAPKGYLYRIDPVTLETMGQKQLHQTLLVHHTSHPHVMPNGDVYNVGIYYMDGNLQHAVVKFPFIGKGDMFKSAEIVGSFKSRWRLHPAYMHSFGVTENYFVLVEQPMAIAVVECLVCQFTCRQHRSMIKEFPEYETQIVLIHRSTGAVKRYRAETFFYIHTINCYEDSGTVVVDLCTYRDSRFLDLLYVELIENMSTDPLYKSWTYTRPKRLEIPLDAPESTVIRPRLLADVGCDMPTINYEHRNGRPYKYFYGIVIDANSELEGAIVKTDVLTGEVISWRETDYCPSEAVFVPSPHAKTEDDGVLLSVLLHGQDERAVQLLILDAASLKEIARAHFRTPSSVPKCFHGWFLNQSRF